MNSIFESISISKIINEAIQLHFQRMSKYKIESLAIEKMNNYTNLTKKNKKFKLVSLTENKIINKKIAGIKLNLNNVEAFKNTNVIIDFTVPKCTLDVLRIASKLKKKVVIGTTGFTKREENLIKNNKIPKLLMLTKGPGNCGKKA